jgi:hypothetical protein
LLEASDCVDETAIRTSPKKISEGFALYCSSNSPRAKEVTMTIEEDEIARAHVLKGCLLPLGPKSFPRAELAPAY